MANIRAEKFVRLLFVLLPAVFFIGFFLICTFSPYYRDGIMYDSDINWILKTGEYIVTNNFNIPRVDIYSYTCPDRAWVVYQWLFEVVMYYFYLITGGVSGVGVFATVLLVTTLTGLFVLLVKEGVNPVIGFIGVIIAYNLFDVNLYARPALATYCFTVLLLLLLFRLEQKKYFYLAFIPVLFVVWANMHLGVTSGILVLLIYTIIIGCKALIYNDSSLTGLLKILAVALVLAVLASLVNPWGFHLYTYLYGLSASEYMNNNIKELLSPNFHSSYSKPIIISIGLTALLAGYTRRIKVLYIAGYALSLVLMLFFVRNVGFYAVFVTIILAMQLQNLVNEVSISPKIRWWFKAPFELLGIWDQFYRDKIRSVDSKRLFWLPFGLVIVFLAIILPVYRIDYVQKHFGYTLDLKKYRPYNAYNFIKKYHPSGNLYSTASWGSYAIWKLYPDYKVFIDTRFDMYGESFFKMQISLKAGSYKWNKLVDRYKINLVAADRKSGLYRILSDELYKDWFVVYEDDLAGLFMKDTPENRLWYEKTQSLRKKSGE